MEYDILNEIITCSVGRLFDKSFEEINFYKTENNKKFPILEKDPPKKQNTEKESLNLFKDKNSLKSKNDDNQKKHDQLILKTNLNTMDLILSPNEQQIKSDENPPKKIENVFNRAFSFEDKTSDNEKKSDFSKNKPTSMDDLDKFTKNNEKNKASTNNNHHDKLKKNISSVDQWLNSEGPKILLQGLKRLNIDEKHINRSLIEKMDIFSLNNEKKRVKNELKNYDNNFEEFFKRQPVRNEKEPMRPLYIYYKLIKQHLEKDEKRKDKKEDNNNNNEKKNENSNKVEKPFNNKISTNDIKNNLEEMKKIKNELRNKLQHYQEEFCKNNNRKIKYNKDIAPIEADYKKYKEIKEEIAKFENFLSNHK